MLSPAQSTALNLHNLFATLHRLLPSVPAAAVLLDAEKAFNSLECPFLYTTLGRVGGPDWFLAVIKLLYSTPTARIRLNCTLIPAFPLSRGTRQGCPLSPLLFVPALDPLVRHLQDEHSQRGLQINTGPLLITLYADDIILYVGQRAANLAPLLSEITRYGTLSGLCTNWQKSEVFPLTDAPCGEVEGYPLSWCEDSVF